MKAEIAWQRVESAIRRVGSYTSITFNDPAIHGAIDMLGGWVHIAEQTYDQLADTKEKFLRIYSDIQANSRPYPSILLGRHDRQNTASGQYHTPRYLARA